MKIKTNTLDLLVATYNSTFLSVSLICGILWVTYLAFSFGSSGEIAKAGLFVVIALALTLAFFIHCAGLRFFLTGQTTR